MDMILGAAVGLSQTALAVGVTALVLLTLSFVHHREALVRTRG